MTDTAERARHLVLVTSLLRGGGAERIVATLANAWARQGERVSILVLRELDGTEYAVDQTVTVRSLSLIAESNPWWHLHGLTQLGTLRQAIEEARPSLLVSFETKLNIAVLLSGAASAVPTLCTEHLVPAEARLGLAWHLLRHLALAGPGWWVAPTRAIAKDFWRFGWACHVLPYPGSYDTVVTPTPLTQRPKRLVAAGRLSPVKGFDRLISAFARVRSELPGWTLQIAGEGEERRILERLIESLNLSSCVRLLGRSENVRGFLAEGRLAVISSRSEAYPMVLLEALSVGTPVLAIPSSESLVELGGDWVQWSDGQTVESLAQGILSAVRHEERLVQKSIRGLALAERHLPSAVARMWLECVGGLLG